MGRTRLARASIKELKQRIEISNQRKAELTKYLHNLWDSYQKGLISRDFYVETAHKHFDGKTLKQWIDYYEHYIEECERYLRKYRKDRVKRHFVTLVLSALIIFLALFIISKTQIQLPITGFVAFNVSDNRTIGYEFLDDGKVVHIWNTQDDYFFNKSSGIQFSNHYQEYWTKNIFCAGYKAGEEWIYDCNDALPFNWNIKTDNETYVNITGWREKTIGTKEVRLGLRYHLKLDDKNLSVQLNVENIGTEDIINDLGFAWKSKDIQIGTDEEDDWIKINNSYYNLSENLDLTFTNMNESYYKIYDYKTHEFLRLDWNNNLNYRLDVKSQYGQYNSPVTLGINVGTLAVGQTKTTTMYWIDAITVSGDTGQGYTEDVKDGIAWNHQFDCGENMELIVGIAIDADVGNSVSTVTYNQTSLSKIYRHTSGDGEEQVEMWNLSNPACGESLEVAVTFVDTGTKEEAAGGSVVFYGVDYVNLSTITTSECDGCSSSSIVVPAKPNDIVVDVIAVDIDPLLSAGGNQTILINYDSGADTIGMSYGSVTENSLTMTWTWASDEFATIGVALIPINVVEWNQTTLDLGESVNNITSLVEISSFKANTGVNVDCTGNCTEITTNWTTISMSDGQIEQVLITCSNATAGSFDAKFNVTSDEDTSSNLINVTCEIFTYGWLNVSIQKPDDNSEFNQYDTNLTINVSIICQGGTNAKCGTVEALARYNLGSSPDTAINTTEGGLPFYILGGVSNPQSTTQNLSQGNSYQFNWTLNVTMASQVSHEIDVLFNSSYGSENVDNNDTEDRTVKLNPFDKDPTVTLNSPVDYYNTTEAITFNCTASDDINLVNVSLYGNWTGSWLLNETNSSPVNATPVIFSKTINDGTYVWNCYACDNATTTQCFFADANRTFTIDLTPPTITWEPPTPDDGNVTSNNWVYLNTTINDVSSTSAFFDWNYSLVGYWAMDWYNSTGIHDNSTYKNFATFQGADFGTDNITTGKYGKGLEFDGNDDFLTIPSSASSLDFNGRAEATMEVWIKKSGVSQKMILWQENQYGITTVSSNAVQSIFKTSGGNVQLNGPVVGTDWTHIAITYDGDVGRLYVNGSEEDNNSISGTISGAATTVYIGRWQFSSMYFDGVVDEVRIHNRTLSPEEINASYNNGLYRLYHNFTNLSDGTYNYSAYAIDTVGKINKTERTVTVDTESPKWFDNSTNSTIAGAYIEHRVRWTDAGLSGYIFEFDNGTGTFNNDSFVTFTGTNNWSNVSKVVNSTEGSTIRWRVYTNDTASPTNWNATDIFEYDTTSAEDTDSPKWFDNSTNGTQAGTYIEHRVRWTDTALSGYIFSFDNGTGSFNNDSFVTFTGTNNWSNVSKVVNSTEGSTIRWRVYANDTASPTNWNSTDIFQYDTTSADNPPTTSLGTNPIAYYNDSDGSIVFDLKCSDDIGMGTLKLYGNWSGWHANQTNSSPVNNTWWNVTVNGIPDGTWKWGAWCNDSLGNSDWSEENRTLTVTAITNCTNITSSGNYYLQNDILSSPETACINISSSDVTFDCQGFDIQGQDTSSTYGIYASSSEGSEYQNITIKNCNVTDWWRGVYLRYSDNGNIQNVTISSSTNNGLVFSYSDNNNVTNITVNNNQLYGVQFGNSKNNQLTNSVLLNNTKYDFDIAVDNDAECNHILTNVNGTDNKPIVYYNYSVTIENWNNNVSEILLCNADNSVINNVTMNHTDKENNAIFLFRVESTNISNTQIYNLYDGLYIFYSDNNQFTNITVNSNSHYGLWLYLSDSNNLTNITVNSNSFGLELRYANNNTLTNSHIETNTGFGIYFIDTGQNNPNIFYNNLFNNTNNIGFSGTTYNNSWNTTEQAGERIYSNGTEIGGNYWSHPSGSGFSDDCDDTDNDGFCEDAYNVTNDEACTPGVNCGGNVDYLAYSNNYSAVEDTIPPKWFDNSTNGTTAGTYIEHRVRWTDAGLSGYIFEFDNGTGTFNNDSFVTFTGTNNWSNVSKVVNSTEGSTIRWRVYANDTASPSNWNQTDIFQYDTTSANNPPTIDWVESIDPQTPIDDTIKSITFNFTATDQEGASDINVSTAQARFQLAGEPTRSNLSCVNWSQSGNNVNFTCTIDMWYFDKADTEWIINVTIKDNSGDSGENSSTEFQYNTLTAMKISPTSLEWDEINLTDTDTGSNNDPILINNTGNEELLNINVTAFDLQGEEYTSYYIYAANFTVENASQGCSGSATAMANATSINITSAILYRGNHSLNYKNATSGQEELFFCLKEIPSENPAQSYSSSAFGAWEIRILLVAVIPAIRRRKKKLKKRKEITENLSMPTTIFSENIGALETVIKYLKENLGMNYHEIARYLNRDERTIWTAYQKAIQKQHQMIEVKETKMFLPVSILRNRKLTVLESLIVYLKSKEMKYSEIAEIIRRDQRNIRTAHQKAVKKLKEREFKDLIKTKAELIIPATIFSKKLGVLESLIKYMKENLNMKYKEIANELKRDQRTIWTAYKKAIEKQKEQIKPKETDIMLPISIFKDERLTILESIILYLKSKELKYSEIAKLLDRDQRNIWTIYSRTKKKVYHKNNNI